MSHKTWGGWPIVHAEMSYSVTKVKDVCLLTLSHTMWVLGVSWFHTENTVIVSRIERYLFFVQCNGTHVLECLEEVSQNMYCISSVIEYIVIEVSQNIPFYTYSVTLAYNRISIIIYLRHLFWSVYSETLTLEIYS